MRSGGFGLGVTSDYLDDGKVGPAEEEEKEEEAESRGALFLLPSTFLLPICRGR